MTAIVRPTFHFTMAESIYEKIQNRSAVYNYFLGKSLPFLAEASLTAAPLPINNIQYEKETRRNIISVKQLQINDVAFVTRRIDWQSGTVYDMFDDSSSVTLDQLNFYVVTDDYNVYKCIDNNYAVQSTVKPAGTDSSGFITTSDGYVWKFMYFIPLSLRNKFMTSAYIPVPRQEKNRWYSQGTISNYIINDGGQDYDPEQTYAVVQGDGQDADIDLVIEDGTITGLIINDPGTGYTTASLSVTKGPLDPGSGADIDLVLSDPGDLDTLQADVEALTVDGELSAIKVITSSSGFTSAPTVTITGDGEGASAICNLDVNGKIVSITLTNRGSGYSYANISIASQGNLTATARAITSPVGGHGYHSPRELVANVLCFYTSFENETNHGISVNNDFRQFGIVKDIEKYNISSKYINDSGSACWKIQGSFTGLNYASDSTIFTEDNTKSLYVISSENNQMIVQSLDGSIPEVGDIFTNSAEYDFEITAITEPDVDRFKGEVLFIDNRLAFTSSSEQSVIFRTFVRF